MVTRREVRRVTRDAAVNGRCMQKASVHSPTISLSIGTRVFFIVHFESTQSLIARVLA